MARASALAPLRVWDLPTRLFHWSLAAAVAVACASAHAAGEAAQHLHFASGYLVLALVVFRVLWGFAGPRYARFAQFVRAPGATWRYALALLRAPVPGAAAAPGHNPLGALSVLALLAVCGVQAASGLFADDQIASQGPLAHLVADATVARAGAWHAWGEIALYALAGLHLCAIAFYQFARGADVLGPMLSGRTRLVRTSGVAPATGDDDDEDDGGVRARALLLFAASAALVAYLVGLG